MRPDIIMSGGQTGVDRAAWDAARACGLVIDGWVPRGRRAEDGVIGEEYGPLRETKSAGWDERTTANVRDSDATLILFRGELTGGTAFTHREAVRLGRPVLSVDLDAAPAEEIVGRIRRWLDAQHGATLNVAGPRESVRPGIGAAAREMLMRILR